jgi:hypothetical protein
MKALLPGRIRRHLRDNLRIARTHAILPEAVSDVVTLEYLRILAPHHEPPVPGNALWQIDWRSRTDRGLQPLPGRGCLEHDHLVFVPLNGSVPVHFGYESALARWAVRESRGSWLPSFTRQARAIARALVAEMAGECACEVCGRWPVDIHHVIDPERGFMSFERIRDDYLDLRGLADDSLSLEHWLDDLDHQAEWIAFHQSRFCGRPLCKKCHRLSHRMSS